jgi:hypothetical protein
MSYSISEYSYGALTEWRNSCADEQGQVGRFTRVAFECGYAGLVPLSALEASVWAIYALVVKGAAFLGCFIFFDAVSGCLDALDNHYTQVAKAHMIAGATATAASVLSLGSNLVTSGSLDEKAQRQTVKNCADKRLVTYWSPAHITKYAKPFCLTALKAVTQWRNDFIHPDTGDIVRSTKVFKQLCAVPLYLGIAVVGAVEALARIIAPVALAIFIAIPFVYILTPISGGLTWLLKWTCLDNLISYNNITRFYNQYLKDMGEQGIGMGASAGYALGTSIAAVISLKDNFIKSTPMHTIKSVKRGKYRYYNYPDRMNERGQMDHKKQINFALDVALVCGVVLASPGMCIGGGLLAAAASVQVVVGYPLLALAEGVYNIAKVVLIGVCHIVGGVVRAIIKTGDEVLKGLCEGVSLVAEGVLALVGGAAVGVSIAAIETGRSLVECVSPSSYH